VIEGDELDLFARSVRHVTETHTGADLDAALVELGWHDALTHDRRAAVSTLFEAQGSSNATSSALDAVLLRALGVDVAGFAVVLPALARWAPPGELDRMQLTVAGLATSALAECDTAVVVASAGEKHEAVTVPTALLSIRTVRGLDPTLALAEVHGDVEARGSEPAPAWTDAVTLGQLALGHELVGVSREMLELARQHALDRIQFGRPVATFQAVRHRLAESLVAIEMAAAALDGAWIDGWPVSAAMAKAVAGRSARIAMRHCQQVLAGVGFTTEHPFHRYARPTPRIVEGTHETPRDRTTSHAPAPAAAPALTSPVTGPGSKRA
jgi:hypothetical protein